MTKEQYLALTDQEIESMTFEKCDAAIDCLRSCYDEPVYEKICTQRHRTMALMDLDYSGNEITVGAIKELIKDMKDTDAIQIYDTYNETSIDPFDVFKTVKADNKGRTHIIFMINTD